MKIKNQLTGTLVISDVLVDEVSQYQSGIKQLALSANGTAGDSAEIVDSIAGESKALADALRLGQVKIVGGSQKLGAAVVPGVLGGKGGGPAFEGVVKTNRVEAGPLNIFRIMFGKPVVGDEIVDLEIDGYAVAATADVKHSADALYNVSGTVTSALALAAVSGNVILTFTGAAVTDQAGYTVFAKQAV